MKTRVALAVAAIAAIAAVSAPAAFANHSWGKYHWARTASDGSFTLDLARNTTSPWTTMLTAASSAWNASTGPSTVLHTNVVTGDDSDRKACPPVLGRVEVCNADYGASGWLGLAQIWIYRGGSHIAQGVTELNDYYFSGAGKSYQYNNSAEQQHVVCQEVGHTFGLDHQDESGISLDTCMDYYHNTSSTDTEQHRHAVDEAERRRLRRAELHLRPGLQASARLEPREYHLCQLHTHLPRDGSPRLVRLRRRGRGVLSVRIAYADVEVRGAACGRRSHGDLRHLGRVLAGTPREGGTSALPGLLCRRRTVSCQRFARWRKRFGRRA
jgi:hypothetical protein